MAQAERDGCCCAAAGRAWRQAGCAKAFPLHVICSPVNLDVLPPRIYAQRDRRQLASSQSHSAACSAPPRTRWRRHSQPPLTGPKCDPHNAAATSTCTCITITTTISPRCRRPLPLYGSLFCPPACPPAPWSPPHTITSPRVMCRSRCLTDQLPGSCRTRTGITHPGENPRGGGTLGRLG